MSLPRRLTPIFKPVMGDHHLLAVSGGRDSMALFHLYLHFRKYFGLNFSVLHFHHGPSANPLTLDYRFNAYDFVSYQCKQHQVPLISNYSGQGVEKFLRDFSSVLLEKHREKKPLESEAAFRKQRLAFFRKTMDETKAQWLVLAHHREDLLETRLIRLLRGTGELGLVAMKVRSGSRFRPLLNTMPEDLKLFLEQVQGAWIDDPSNKDPRYMRNWLRLKWLRDLEEFRPGSKNVLARSLELLAKNQTQNPDIHHCFSENAVNLTELLSCSSELKKLVIATYMKSQGLKNYSQSHVNEVLKRLDTDKKSHSFKLLGRVWCIDAGQMKVQGPGGLSETT